MKELACLVLVLSLWLSANAQKNVTISRTYKNDNNRLQLIIHVTKDEGTVTYENEYDIKGWNKTKTDSLVNYLVDSIQKAPYKKVERPANDRENYLSKSVNDNGETLTLTIEARKNHNQGIYYKNDFKVSGMNQKQKDRIVDSVMTTLGLRD